MSDTDRYPQAEAWADPETSRHRAALEAYRGAPRFPTEAPRTLKVNQLDANRLDKEISSMFRNAFAEAFSLLKPGAFERFKPEVDAVIYAFIFKYTVWEDEPTPGCHLQNLRYAQAWYRGPAEGAPKITRKQKFGYFVFCILFPWLARRMPRLYEQLDERESSEDESASGRGRRLLRVLLRFVCLKVLPRVDKILSLFSMLNTLHFLKTGMYRSLSDRILGIRLVHLDPLAVRAISFEFLNRYLIWEGFSEFLLTIIPLLNLGNIRGNLTKRLVPRRMRRNMDLQSLSVCGFCNKEASNLPMQAACGHVFCYFCIASAQMDRENPPCPRCEKPLTTFDHRPM